MTKKELEQFVNSLTSVELYEVKFLAEARIGAHKQAIRKPHPHRGKELARDPGDTPAPDHSNRRSDDGQERR